MKEKTKLFIILLTIICIYIGLPILILLNVINFNYKFYYLTFGSIFVYFIMRVLGFNNPELGITLQNTKESIKNIIPITSLIILITIILLLINVNYKFHTKETILFYIFYIFISSPVQEFLYRGALNKMMDYLKIKDSNKLFFTSTLYSFVHIIYKNPLTLVFTFIMGLIWHQNYIKTNNLIGVSISHAVLGVLTIGTGVI